MSNQRKKRYEYYIFPYGQRGVGLRYDHKEGQVLIGGYNTDVGIMRNVIITYFGRKDGLEGKQVQRNKIRFIYEISYDDFINCIEKIREHNFTCCKEKTLGRLIR